MELKLSKKLNEQGNLVATIEWYDYKLTKNNLGQPVEEKVFVGVLESEPIDIENDIVESDYCFYIENASSLALASCKTTEELQAILLWQTIQWQIVNRLIKMFPDKVGFEHIMGAEIPNTFAFVFCYHAFNDNCNKNL